MATPPITLCIHGGAWAIPDAAVAETTDGLHASLTAGYAVLAAGGSALDAVETAVRILEDLPVFDAGVGSVLNANEEVECDALIIDGDTLCSGGVIGLNNSLHPVTVARRLMETTPHSLIAGAGARDFAKASGECCEESELVTPAAREEWLRQKTYHGTVDSLFAGRVGVGHDTVGAVALDGAGRLAAATSTGGITMKMRGRVGDSPLVGSGAYADSAVGAASTTGHGESIVKCLLAARASGAMSTHLPSFAAPIECSDAQRSAAIAVGHMLQRVGGFGGAIVVLPNGDVGAAHTTPRMAWGYERGVFVPQSSTVTPPASRRAVGVRLGKTGGATAAVDATSSACDFLRWEWLE
jgi:L-asparaginase / beta-aspartyl-peptidase